MIRKVSKLIAIALFLGMLLYFGIFFWGSHSESFKFVEQTVMNSRNLQSQIGAIEHVRLTPFGSFREKFVDSDKWATMTIEVIGANKTITLDVRTKKLNDVWTIEQALLNGKTVVLN